MFVAMYRITVLEPSKINAIRDRLEKVQSRIRRPSGCAGQRLLVALDSSADFIAVSYWQDGPSLEKAEKIHDEINEALDGFEVDRKATSYEIVLEL